MVLLKSYGDPALYSNYYRAQAGHGLPGYQGAPVMYGAGVGGVFRSLFRKAVPLLRRGFEIIRPHVKTAARNIARDVVGNVSQAILNKVNTQEGAGLVYMKRRKGLKRKAAQAQLTGPPRPFKRKAKRRQVTQKKVAKRQRGRKKGRSRDIF